ncbi:hypothetical protein F4553_007850 [Allocatelliglobosispora scoriae]|uniref:Cupin-like domain-containing protein n=1 Tax=Allocatelliglobosispora scoriae TaxID=643052 RepID=A0A841C3C9_9ACTN|nr:cupin-like domain-containing protein [Allocatelliglobosispora scoriae]MBB5874416.1 hypothetical protein [Allocatelliglobosispora scoriae]
MTTTEATRLDHGWRIWLAENLAMGAPVEEVRAAALAQSIDPADLDAELEQLTGHPYFAVSRRMALRYDWLESIMDVYRLLRNGDGGRELDRRTAIDPAEFFARYYFGHRPVVLDGLLDDWPAREWTLDEMARRCGDAQVEVMTGREANPEHAWQYDRHRTTMPFGDYLRLVGAGSRTNDFYMVPRNSNWPGALRPLVGDVRAPAGIIDAVDGTEHGTCCSARPGP